MRGDAAEAEVPQIVVQVRCDVQAFEALCVDIGLSTRRLVLQYALDGDAYTVGLIVACSAAVLHRLQALVQTLLSERHPVRITVGDAEVSGISKDDLPRVAEFLKECERSASDRGVQNTRSAEDELG